MRIAVFGASSGIGRELAFQARTAGHHVVAVARSIGSEAAASLTPVKGSILDFGVAERAVAGADAVAWCVGVKTLGPAFLRTVTVFSEGTRRVIEAMKGSGVSRLTVITARDHSCRREGFPSQSIGPGGDEQEAHAPGRPRDELRRQGRRPPARGLRRGKMVRLHREQRILPSIKTGLPLAVLDGRWSPPTLGM
jgi:nucleoside-diphosphate-sugar epimerase